MGKGPEAEPGVIVPLLPLPDRSFSVVLEKPLSGQYPTRLPGLTLMGRSPDANLLISVPERTVFQIAPSAR